MDFPAQAPSTLKEAWASRTERGVVLFVRALDGDMVAIPEKWFKDLRKVIEKEKES